jgi:glycosyltransferase involved in cell wall biosynthesis
MPQHNGQSEERVTVVIPTYNRAALLPRAIDSVLRQTRADLCDIVVVDDGSTDETLDVLTRYGDRAHCIGQANAGAGAARNTAIRASQNEFVAFLDSDDEWLPQKTEQQLAAFRRWPEVVLVAGRSIERFADGHTAPRRVPDIPLDQPTDFAPHLFHMNMMPTPAIMVRRSCLNDVGPFRTDLSRSQDYHLWTRIACRGPCVFLDAVVATYAADTPESLQRNRDVARLENLRARRMLRRELRNRPDCRKHWRDGIVRHLVAMRDQAYGEGRFLEATWRGLESFWYQPWSRPRWEWGRLFSSLLHTILPRARHRCRSEQRSAG